MKILDGKEISERILNEVASLMSILPVGEMPVLDIILATNDIAARKYVQLKSKRAEQVGIRVNVHEFDEQVSHQQIVERVLNLASTTDSGNSTTNGIMVQLPLFSHLQPHQEEILNSIPQHLDVDGLGAANLGLVITGSGLAILPATVAAVWECIMESTKALQPTSEASELERVPSNTTNTDSNHSSQTSDVGGGVPQAHRRRNIFPTNSCLKGKHAVIINHSTLIGRPLAELLLHSGATVTVCHEHTQDLAAFTRQAYILISATGVTQLINANMVKEQAILIDVTSIPGPNGQVLGDIIVSSSLDERIAARTPVPGGVGPVTVACLLRNLAHAAITQYGK